jgi:hypothetical protein
MFAQRMAGESASVGPSRQGNDAAMERPESSELDAIFATAAEIRATEARLKELKVQGSAQAQALANIADKKVRLAAAIYAYWYAPEINASDLSFGATGKAHPSALLKLVGPVSVGVPCERCGQDMPITSRANMKAVLDGVQNGPRAVSSRPMPLSMSTAPASELSQSSGLVVFDLGRRRATRSRGEPFSLIATPAPNRTTATTAAAWTTGPVMESTTCWSGPSQGMPEPPARA